MQNLILAKSNISNVFYTFSNSNIVVKSFEEACYVLYNDIILNKDIIFSEEFLAFLENLELNRFSKMLKDNSIDKVDKILTLLFHSDMFSNEQLMDLKKKLESFEEEPLWIQYKTIAKEYAKQNNIKASLKYYELSLGQNLDVNVVMNIGYLYKLLRKYSESIKYFEKAISIELNEFVCEQLLDCYIVIKNIDRIKLILTKAEKQLSNDKFVYYCAELERIENNDDNHMELYKEAYRINPNEKYVLKIADHYISKRQYTQAYEFLETCGNTVLISLKMAEVINLCDNGKKAIQYLENCLEKENNNSRVIAEIAKYKRLTYDVQGANTFIIRNAGFVSEDKHIIFEKARINKALGNQKEYFNSLSHLLELYKDEYKIST